MASFSILQIKVQGWGGFAGALLRGLAGVIVLITAIIQIVRWRCRRRQGPRSSRPALESAGEIPLLKRARDGAAGEKAGVKLPIAEVVQEGDIVNVNRTKIEEESGEEEEEQKEVEEVRGDGERGERADGAEGGREGEADRARGGRGGGADRGGLARARRGTERVRTHGDALTL